MCLLNVKTYSTEKKFICQVFFYWLQNKNKKAKISNTIYASKRKVKRFFDIFSVATPNCAILYEVEVSILSL